MKKLFWGIVLVITLVMLHKCHRENRDAQVNDNHITCTITKADTTFTREVEATYPLGVGERVYTAREINGKNIVSKVECSGRLKPKSERTKKSGYITPRVIYILLDDGAIIVSKMPDVVAPLTEEAARELLTN